MAVAIVRLGARPPCVNSTSSSAGDRPVTSASEGRVVVRSRFGYGDRNEVGYRVELTDRTDANALGRVSGAAVDLKIAEFNPAPIVAPDQWQECEIRAERARLSVRVNGVLVTEAQALDEFTGYVALQVSRGGIEFRNLRAARQPSASDTFGQGAYRASEPGIVNVHSTPMLFVSLAEAKSPARSAGLLGKYRLRVRQWRN